MTVGYGIYERNRLKAYRDDVYVEDIVCCYDNEADAQTMVLALTEDYIYAAFCRECNNCGLDIALWLFQHAPKYGWDKYIIKPIKRD